MVRTPVKTCSACAVHADYDVCAPSGVNLVSWWCDFIAHKSPLWPLAVTRACREL